MQNSYRQILISVITLSFFLTGSIIGYAQSQWQWGKRGGSMGASANNNVRDAVTDRYGNVYATVSGKGISDIDGHLSANARDKLFFGSWSCNGNFRWLKSYGGKAAGGAYIGLLNSDTLGNIYAVSWVSNLSASDTSYMDTDTIFAGAMTALALLKYDTAGTVQWQRILTFNAGGACPLDMDVMPDGSIFLFAYLPAGVYANGAINISATGYYVVRYNTAGGYQSATRLNMNSAKMTITGLNGILGNGDLFFRYDRVGNIYYVGGAYPASQLGNLTIGLTSITTTDALTISPMFLAAFTNTGTNIWVEQGSADKRTNISGIATDEDGNVYIGGSSSPGNIFNGDSMNNSLDTGVMMPFVVSVDSSGDNRWVATGACTFATEVRALVYRNNTIALTGQYYKKLEWENSMVTSPHSDVYFGRLNAATGAIMGLDSLRADNFSGLTFALAGDNNSNFYVVSQFSEQISIAANTLHAVDTAGTPYNFFVAKYGSGSSYCYCPIPQPTFTYVNTSGNTYNFTYTGTASFTSISWNFGDGQTANNTSTPTHTYTTPGNYPVCVTVTNSCGANTACHNIKMPTTDVTQVYSKQAIHIYPNPTTGTVIIEHAEACTVIELYDIMGRNIGRFVLKGINDKVDVSGLSPGVYMLRFVNKNGYYSSSKLLVE